MSPSAVIATVAWSAFTLWVVASVARDCVRYRRVLRGRRTVVPCEFRRAAPPLVLGAPPAHPRRRRP